MVVRVDAISCHICLTIRDRVQVAESITLSYVRQYDVLERFSQHATLTLPRLNRAKHLSRCHRQPEPALFKTSLCHVHSVRIPYRKKTQDSRSQCC